MNINNQKLPQFLSNAKILGVARLSSHSSWSSRLQSSVTSSKLALISNADETTTSSKNSNDMENDDDLCGMDFNLIANDDVEKIQRMFPLIKTGSLDLRNFMKNAIRLEEHCDKSDEKLFELKASMLKLRNHLANPEQTSSSTIEMRSNDDLDGFKSIATHWENKGSVRDQLCLLIISIWQLSNLRFRSFLEIKISLTKFMNYLSFFSHIISYLFFWRMPKALAHQKIIHKKTNKFGRMQ